ncbi:MAG: phosphoglucosamine mutase [Acidobacteriia bacterium]|nr:phosphoglucosamine mutase [Terriglobia bacterium]
MGSLFGTDGIRGIAGEPPLDRDDVYRIGYCLTGYLRSMHLQPRLLIGRDTRMSGPWIEGLLRHAIADAGGTAEMCGVVSTPAVSFFTRKTAAHAGIMISASHNPFQDNGIKIFSAHGIKFNDAVEEELETHILTCSLAAPAGFSSDPGAVELQLSVVPRYQDLYADYLSACLAPGFSLTRMRLVVDCAHGSLSYIAPSFLRALGADVHAIHCQPDGRNINLKAGTLHLDALQQEVQARKADIGIAFDGDADRALFVDSAGRIHDGDDVLYLLARYYDLEDAPRVVVGTVMANLGLEVALGNIGFHLVRTAVGDRYVLEEMLRRGAVLGGEQSGHIIMTRLARTGDGLLTALKVLEILVKQDQDFAALCSPVRRFPQVLLNVSVREKVLLEDIPGLRDAEAACKKKLGAHSRILLRYSGTERLARVMVEGENEQAVQQAARHLAAFFENMP